MIELTIKKYLDGHLDVPSFLERQANMPDKFVLYEKTGGGKRNHLQSATFAFQSYAPSLYQAAELNENLKNVVEGLVVLPEIISVELNSDYNFTDTTTKEYRYQAVYDIKYY